jgi:hypothetical protein
MAGTRSDEGWRKCCLDHVGVECFSVRRRSTVAALKIAAVERRKARLSPLKRQAGTFQRGAPCDLRRTALRLPQGGKERHRAKARKRGQNELTSAGTRRAEPEARAHSTAKELAEQNKMRSKTR